MNRIQRVVLLLGIFATIAAGLFPPWTVVDEEQKPRGHYWGYVIQESNNIESEGVTIGRMTYVGKRPSLDHGMLHSEWVLIVLVTGGFLLFFQQRREDQVGSHKQ